MDLRSYSEACLVVMYASCIILLLFNTSRNRNLAMCMHLYGDQVNSDYYLCGEIPSHRNLNVPSELMFSCLLDIVLTISLAVYTLV